MNLENVSSHLVEHVLIYLKLQEFSAADRNDAEEEKLYWQAGRILVMANGDKRYTLQSILEAE